MIDFYLNILTWHYLFQISACFVVKRSFENRKFFKIKLLYLFTGIKILYGLGQWFSNGCHLPYPGRNF